MGGEVESLDFSLRLIDLHCEEWFQSQAFRRGLPRRGSESGELFLSVGHCQLGEHLSVEADAMSVDEGVEPRLGASVIDIRAAQLVEGAPEVMSKIPAAWFVPRGAHDRGVYIGSLHVQPCGGIGIDPPQVFPIELIHRASLSVAGRFLREYFVLAVIEPCGLDRRKRRARSRCDRAAQQRPSGQFLSCHF